MISAASYIKVVNNTTYKDDMDEKIINGLFMCHLNINTFTYKLSCMIQI